MTESDEVTDWEIQDWMQANGYMSWPPWLAEPWNVRKYRRHKSDTEDEKAARKLAEKIEAEILARRATAEGRRTGEQ